MRKIEDLVRAATSKHSFRNNPNKQHQVCVTCGCRRDKTYKNSVGQSIITYYDRYGNLLDGCPTECKSMLDLLNEDEQQ